MSWSPRLWSPPPGMTAPWAPAVSSSFLLPFCRESSPSTPCFKAGKGGLHSISKAVGILTSQAGPTSRGSLCSHIEGEVLTEVRCRCQEAGQAWPGQECPRHGSPGHEQCRGRSGEPHSRGGPWHGYLRYGGVLPLLTLLVPAPACILSSCRLPLYLG